MAHRRTGPPRTPGLPPESGTSGSDSSPRVTGGFSDWGPGDAWPVHGCLPFQACVRTPAAGDVGSRMFPSVFNNVHTWWKARRGSAGLLGLRSSGDLQAQRAGSVCVAACGQTFPRTGATSCPHPCPVCIRPAVRGKPLASRSEEPSLGTRPASGNPRAMLYASLVWFSGSWTVLETQGFVLGPQKSDFSRTSRAKLV